jgi:hypothetical protein
VQASAGAGKDSSTVFVCNDTQVDPRATTMSADDTTSAARVVVEAPLGAPLGAPLAAQRAAIVDKIARLTSADMRAEKRRAYEDAVMQAVSRGVRRAVEGVVDGLLAAAPGMTGSVKTSTVAVQQTVDMPCGLCASGTLDLRGSQVRVDISVVGRDSLKSVSDAARAILPEAWAVVPTDSAGNPTVTCTHPF